MDFAVVLPVVFAFLVILGFLILFSFIPMGLWVSAKAANVRVSLANLVGMRLRKVKPAAIVLPLIKATKAGIELEIAKLEAHLLAGGNVDRVVDALIAAERAGIALDFSRAAAIDLAGRDVRQAVMVSVTPKVITTAPIAAMGFKSW